MKRPRQPKIRPTITAGIDPPRDPPPVTYDGPGEYQTKSGEQLRMEREIMEDNADSGARCVSGGGKGGRTTSHRKRRYRKWLECRDAVAKLHEDYPDLPWRTVFENVAAENDVSFKTVERRVDQRW